MQFGVPQNAYRPTLGAKSQIVTPCDKTNVEVSKLCLSKLLIVLLQCYNAQKLMFLNSRWPDLALANGHDHAYCRPSNHLVMDIAGNGAAGADWLGEQQKGEFLHQEHIL